MFLFFWKWSRIHWSKSHLFQNRLQITTLIAYTRYMFKTKGVANLSCFCNHGAPSETFCNGTAQTPELFWLKGAVAPRVGIFVWNSWLGHLRPILRETGTLMLVIKNPLIVWGLTKAAVIPLMGLLPNGMMSPRWGFAWGTMTIYSNIGIPKRGPRQMMMLPEMWPTWSSTTRYYPHCWKRWRKMVIYSLWLTTSCLKSATCWLDAKFNMMVSVFIEKGGLSRSYFHLPKLKCGKTGTQRRMVYIYKHVTRNTLYNICVWKTKKCLNKEYMFSIHFPVCLLEIPMCPASLGSAGSHMPIHPQRPGCPVGWGLSATGWRRWSANFKRLLNPIYNLNSINYI